MHYIMDKTTMALARKAYLIPGCDTISIRMENIVCNASGTGREDLGNLGGTPTWDPED